MSSPQEMVERALAASTSRACIVLVRSQSVANLRWARNTLTTNGETRATAVSVVAVVDVPGGVAAGSVTLNHPSLEAVAELVARAEAVAVEEGPADDAADLATGIAASPDWADAPHVATSADLAGLAPEIGALFAAGRADGIEHFGYAEQAVTTYYLGTSTGVRLRFADPEGRLELTAKSHERSRSTWAGRAARTLAGLDLAAVDRELRQGLAWQAHRVEVEPGRHTAVLTPSCVADLMIELYWSSVARDAADGQSVWSHAGGGTRAGELVADPRVTLHSDPALPGLEAVPFVVATGSSGSSSVFDNGLPVDAVSWIRRRRPGEPHLDPPHRGRDRPARSAPASTTCGSRSPAPPEASRTWSRAPATASWSRASGTTASSIRRPCCSPGSPATASTPCGAARWSVRSRTSGSTTPRSARSRASPTPATR